MKKLHGLRKRPRGCKQGWRKLRDERVEGLSLNFYSLSSPPSSTMKLTPELLAQASAALNPIKERQLDLRGEHPLSRPLITYTTAHRL